MSGDQAYELIRDAIASGELQPRTRLVEVDLMARFELSRPAVRVALVRLEQEGLIEREKNQSARVRLVKPEEAIEIYEARALLEGEAAGIAARKVTAEELDELEALIRAAESCGRSEAVVPETAFHRRILEIAAHRTIIRLCESLHGHLLRYHHYTSLVEEWSAQSPCEHRAILAALRSGDSAAATATMRSHLDRLTALLKRQFEAV